MNYKIYPGVVLSKVCGEFLLIATREARGHVANVRTLNVTGAYFWHLLEQGFTTDVILSRAMDDYKITYETAEQAFLPFLDSLKEAGYLTEEQP